MEEKKKTKVTSRKTKSKINENKIMMNFIKRAIRIRNLIISILGGSAILLLMFIIQLVIRGSWDLLSWDNDLIFPFILGATLALLNFEKRFKKK